MRSAKVAAAGLAYGASSAHLLEIESGTFHACFDRRPFLIGHELENHPLFEMPRLVQLCQKLRAGSVEYNAGNIPISVHPARTPGNGLDAEETLRRIAECQSWLVLKNVEQDPEYDALLRRCLAQVARHSEPICPGMCDAEAFIFVSSPKAVTPYHMDPEHNFLLQIRGSKRVHMYDGHDRSVLSEEELEDFYCGGHRNLVYPADFERASWAYDLTPGMGLHFPVTAPHYVRNGAEVSVSFSITFRTPELKRRRVVHICNAFLRRRGLRPTPLGVCSWLDQLKYLAAGPSLRASRLVDGLRRRAIHSRALSSPAQQHSTGSGLATKTSAARATR
jgi:hypothetical protein